MSVPRLKTPQGQRPPDQEKRKPINETRLVPRLPEVAARLYQVYADALNWHGPGGTPLKQWHQLSVHDRRAFRAMEEYLRSQLLAQAQVAVPFPPDNTVVLLAAEGSDYRYTEIPRAALPKTGKFKEAVASLYAAIADSRAERGK